MIGPSYPYLLYHVAYAMDVINLMLSYTYLLGLSLYAINA
jgi:hypothetical protein